MNDAELEARLATERYGRSREHHESTASTNDDARARAEAGAPDGHLVVAEIQTTGRGSRGRSWSSPRGGLYFSLVLRPRIAPKSLPALTLAAGLAVAEAIEAVAPAAGRAEVKWPNDVLLGGRKCAGILVESATTAARLDHAIVGVGINVGERDFEGELATTATSVPSTTVEALLAEVLGVLEAKVALFERGGPAALVPTLEQRLAHRGRRARIGEVRGRIVGLSESGALRVDTGAGVETVVAGTLTLVDD